MTTHAPRHLPEATPPTPAALLPPAVARELITFLIGAQEFCVDIMAVREIRGWTPATPLPHAPPWVRGVVNLRGTVLTVVDLAARLGFPPTVASARAVVIVAQVGRRPVGLLVDAVTGILTVPASSVQPTPEVASDLARDFVAGVLAVEGRMISLVTLDPVLPPAERQAA